MALIGPLCSFIIHHEANVTDLNHPPVNSGAFSPALRLSQRTGPGWSCGRTDSPGEAPFGSFSSAACLELLAERFLLSVHQSKEPNMFCTLAKRYMVTQAGPLLLSKGMQRRKL